MVPAWRQVCQQNLIMEENSHLLTTTILTRRPWEKQVENINDNEGFITELWAVKKNEQKELTKVTNGRERRKLLEEQ